MLKLIKTLVCLRWLNISFLLCFFFPCLLNGQGFTVYNYFNSPLPDNRVNCLEIDSSDNLWVGTQYGLVVFNNGVWTDFSDSVPSPVIRDVSIDANGNVWIATNAGLCKYDSVWHYFSPPYASLSSQINCIAFDLNNDPWIGTSNGLFLYKNNVFSLVLDTSSLENFINVKTITFIGDSVVVGTMNGGIGFLYNNACSWLNISPIGGIIDNSFNNFFLDTNNTLWCCSPYGGLQTMFSDGSWYFFNTVSSPGWPSNSLTSIREGDLNKKYLGTKGAGVVVFEFTLAGPSTVVIDSSNSDLPDDFILDVIPLDNFLWVATQFEGLVKIHLPLSLEEELVEAVCVFPTMFNNKLNITAVPPYAVCVYNLNGLLVFEKNVLYSNETINLGTLAAGVYFVSLKFKNTSVVKRVFKF